MTQLTYKNLTLNEWWEWWEGINNHDLPPITTAVYIAGRQVTSIMKIENGYKVWFKNQIDPEIIEDGRWTAKITYEMDTSTMITNKHVAITQANWMKGKDFFYLALGYHL